MLSQEPKDGDFIRYVDALQAGKLAEIKAENRHLEMNDLSDEGWSKRVTAYLARGARRGEPAAPPGVASSGRMLERRHQLMLLGFACLGIAIVLFVVFPVILQMEEGIVLAVWFFFGGMIFLKLAEKETKRGARGNAKK